ncbi:MAG: TatD family hydrolase, partial [bacterium]|nr:TatD family hydrolase [bacterium]
MPKLIDTHAHLNFHAFREDYDEVVERALEEEVWMINVGTQFETSRRAVEMAEEYSDGVYAAIGLHPIHLFEHHVDEEETSFNARGEEFNSDSYKELVARSGKVVAIGEFGLDYFRMPLNTDPQVVKKVQQEVVKQHFILAEEADKPVMIHCRDLPAEASAKEGAYEDLIRIIEEENYHGTGEIHSFTGTWEQAKAFLDLGFFVALNGIITFDKTGRSEEV